MAQTLNLRADQGSDFTINLTVADNLGVAYDLGDWTANSSFKKHHGSSTYYDMSTKTVSAPDGNLDLQLLANSTNSVIPEGRYYYDVVLKSTANTAMKRVMQGIITIDPKVSR
jgi:hypothetical protein